MSSHRQQRLPISCENCRKRKIRCFGDGTPCHTCMKRGLSSTCHFLKDQASKSPRVFQDATSPVAKRMEILEELLKENIALTQRVLRNDHTQSNTEHTPSTCTESRTHEINMRKSGQLVRTTTGHVRYIGTQSTFLDIAAVPPTTDLPFSDRPTTHQELLDLLPPLSRCDELKDVFIDVFSPLFHVLHDPTFEAEYASFRHSPHEASFTFLALVFVVIAIGITALDEGHSLLADLGRQATSGANMRSIAARFRNAAMRALTADHFLWRHNLQTLQTLILLIYALSHAHGPAWSLLGTTLNIATAIGCHVDPSRYEVTQVEAEERRRCWAALLMLYTIQETSLGVQAPIIIQADTQLPADVDDDQLLREDTGANIRVINPRSPSKMAYILRKWKLYRLAAEICSSTTSEVLDEVEIARLDDMLAAEEVEQKSQFAHLENLPIYHQAHYFILDSYTNHLYLVLHSYVLTRPSTTVTPSHLRSIQRVSDASLSILANYETLRSTNVFQKYRWYTDGLGSFHAFLAASTLAVVYGGSHGVDVDMQKKPQVTLELRHCLDHFRSAASRSDICARAASVLSRLLSHTPLQSSRSYSSHTASTTIRTGRDSISNTSSAPTARSYDGVSEPATGSTYSPGVGHLSTELQAAPQHDFEQSSTIADMGVDLDGWTTSAQLEDLFCQIPTQQWLSPSVFPWSKWDSNNSLHGAEVSHGAQSLMYTI